MGNSVIEERSKEPLPLKRRRSQSGLTLVELIVAFSILLILTTMAVPLARYQVRTPARKGFTLADLREMREAINKYKDLCDQGKIQAGDPDTFCYPPKLEVWWRGENEQHPQRKRSK